MEPFAATTIFLVVCVICLIFAWARKPMGTLPPGPSGLPVLGNILQLNSNKMTESLIKLSEKYGPVFTITLGSDPVVVLCSYDAVKEALIDQGEEFSARGNMPILERINRGHGVIGTNGERWKQLRRFSLMTLRNFGMGKRSIEERIQEEAQFLMEELRNTQRQPFDPTVFFSRAVANVICSVVFGNRFDYEDKKFVGLLNVLNETFRLISTNWVQVYNMFPGVMKYMPGPHQTLIKYADQLQDFVSEKAKINRDTLDPNCPTDFIDCFLIKMDQEKDNPVTEFHTEGLVATTFDLFGAGTETVSTTLRYALLILLKHPDVEDSHKVKNVLQKHWNLLLADHDIAESVDSQLSYKYGPVYTIHLGPDPVVVLCSYDAVKEALNDKGEEFSARGNMPIIERINRGHGVISANGERWKQLRRFSLMTLRNFGMGKRSIEERIQEEALFLVEELRKTQSGVLFVVIEKKYIYISSGGVLFLNTPPADTYISILATDFQLFYFKPTVFRHFLIDGTRMNGGLPFEPTFFFSRAVSNVICSVVFGNRFDYEDKNFLVLLTLINDTFQLFSSVWGQMYNFFPGIMEYIPGPHHRLFKDVQQIQDFAAEKVKGHRETLDPSCPRDFIDCFLIKMDQEKQNPASEFHTEGLVVTTFDLFSAGTETVSTTLRYGLMVLMKYPHIAGKVHEEIDRVIGRNRAPSINDRSNMPYTDAVIHEIQRLADIVPMGLPHTVTRDVHFRDYVIPKGTTVFPMLSAVLHDPKLFKNAHTFDPEHFLDEKGGFKRNEAFMPFSTGRRICLGEGLARMELFLFLTTILQNFNLKYPGNPKDIDLTPQMSGFGNFPRPYKLCLTPR